MESATSTPPMEDDWNGAPLMWAYGFAAFCMIVIPSLRVYGRLYLLDGHRVLAMDDILMLIATFLGLCYIVTMVIAYTVGGGGRHINLVTLDELKGYLTAFYVSGPLYMMTMGFIKCSMLALYWRLSRPHSRFRKVIVFWAVFISLMSVALSITTLLPCKPIRKAYDPTVPGTCINQVPFWFAQSSLMIATDLVVYVLPLRLIWQIQLPKRQKITLTALFGLGGLACIAGIVKLTCLPPLLKNPDVLYGGTTSLVWGIVEMWVGIVAGSGPSLKIVVRKFFGPILGSSFNSKSNGGTSGPSNVVRTGKSQYNSYNLSNRGHNAVHTEVSVKPMDPSNDSTELIIPDHGGILRTTEVRRDIEIQSQTSDRS